MEINEKIKEYLKNNLTICISQDQEFGPVETIKVTLELEGEEISEASCNLPESD